MEKQKDNFKTIKQVIPQVKKQTYRQAIVKLNGQSKNIEQSISDIALNYNRDYEWTHEIIKVHEDLANYFYGIKHSLDLDKGIALMGVYGVGKSTIFNIWHDHLRFNHPFCDNLFINASLEEILDDISEHGYINRKFVNNVTETSCGSKNINPRHILINEFGQRYDIKTYGTDINQLFESFMMKRYDIFQQRKKLTHITTNFGADELENLFHPKLIDRFKEMFNIIELKGESFRK